MAEALLKDPEQLSLVRERNQVINGVLIGLQSQLTTHIQVLFVWTDEQNDRATVQHLKKLGVDGVIYDRMDQNNEKPVKESVFLTEVVLPIPL